MCDVPMLKGTKHAVMNSRMHVYVQKMKEDVVAIEQVSDVRWRDEIPQFFLYSNIFCIMCARSSGFYALIYMLLASAYVWLGIITEEWNSYIRAYDSQGY